MGFIELAVVNRTIHKIDALYPYLGTGEPNDGRILNSTLSYFDKALKDLGSAFPGNSWKGLAANKYSSKNQGFMDIFKNLMDVVKKVQGLIGNQADAVKRARKVLDSQKKLLQDFRPFAVFPGIGTYTLCAVAMHRVNAALNALKSQSQRNGDLLSRLMDAIKKLLQMISQLIPHGVPGGLPIPIPGGGTPGGGGWQPSGGGGSQPSSSSTGAPGSGSGDAQGVGGSDATSGLIGAGTLRSASPRFELRPRDGDLAGSSTEMLGGPPQPLAAQVRPSGGMGGMAPGSAGAGRPAAASKRTKKKDGKTKKYFEGAEVGTNSTERAPVEVVNLQERRETEMQGAGTGTSVPAR